MSLFLSLAVDSSALDAKRLKKAVGIIFFFIGVVVAVSGAAYYWWKQRCVDISVAVMSLVRDGDRDQTESFGSVTLSFHASGLTSAH